jgi:hypothetical protein
MEGRCDDEHAKLLYSALCGSVTSRAKELENGVEFWGGQICPGASLPALSKISDECLIAVADSLLNDTSLCEVTGNESRRAGSVRTPTRFPVPV